MLTREKRVKKNITKIKIFKATTTMVMTTKRKKVKKT
jgi:hypothetical protein